MESYDALVVGGGMVGSAIGWGLQRRGLKTAMLDEGDAAFRAARANHGLVWVQSKGPGMPAYQEWTRRSAELWPDLAAELEETTGISPAYSRPGGLVPCLSEDELAERRRFVEAMHTENRCYECEMLDGAACRKMIPALGPEVVGGSFSRYDGHAEPLRLLRALHAGFRALGGTHHPGRPAMAVGRDGEAFRVDTPDGPVAAAKMVLAAGLGVARLAAMVGLGLPIRPQRGQLIVTERAVPLLPVLLLSIRQAAEGTFLIGDSREDVGFDNSTTITANAEMAARAVRTVPALGPARIVRIWGALRVMTPDQFPAYEESREFPGAYVATCHSGVTLAAAHALRLAPAIAEGRVGDELTAFARRRFAERRAA